MTNPAAIQVKPVNNGIGVSSLSSVEGEGNRSEIPPYHSAPQLSSLSSPALGSEPEENTPITPFLLPIFLIYYIIKYIKTKKNSDIRGGGL